MRSEAKRAEDDVGKKMTCRDRRIFRHVAAHAKRVARCVVSRIGARSRDTGFWMGYGKAGW